jgi:hypothetical protein
VNVANSGQSASPIVFRRLLVASVSVVGGTHGFTISSKSRSRSEHLGQSNIEATESTSRTRTSPVGRPRQHAGQPVQGFVARGIRLTGDTAGGERVRSGSQLPRPASTS